MAEKEFDLNIEKILESWEVFHAVREIIANALDEQFLTKTKDIAIYKTEDGCWHIVDYGRGLNYHHLTQNENEEKLNNEGLIGRFGVGLKDALATLYRNNIKVRISSKYGIIQLKQSTKLGFDDIKTLHADIAKPDDENMIGTDFCMDGCTDEDIEKAKSLFLKYSKCVVLEKTPYGEVLEKNGESASIYINGVKVSEEPDFLFSYNITMLNPKLKKALNRERTNVGRTAYADRIKLILQECKNPAVIISLIEDLRLIGRGEMHDEMKWRDIQMYASKMIKVLDSKTVFITTEDLQQNPAVLDRMKREGYSTVVVSAKLIDDMDDSNKNADDGEIFTTINQYNKEQEARFKPCIISIDELTDEEKRIYFLTDDILKLIGGKPKNVKKIEITKKLYEKETYIETLGLWLPNEGKILIKRNRLSSVFEYAGTLLHECAHAISEAGDVSREFESLLTNMIGLLADRILTKKDFK